MQIPRSVFDAYNKAVKQCGDKAEKAAKKALEAWMTANPNASVAQTREAAKAILTELGTTYGASSGDAAYAFRNVLANVAGVGLPNVEYSYIPDAESIDKTARYQAGKLDKGKVDDFVQGISEAARFYSERGANDTMHELTKHDAERLGKRVRFARVPTGATNCDFCLMLASRGFDYYSAKSAGEANEFHRNCDCRIVPGYGDNPSVEGYDPDELYDRWKHPEKYQDEITPGMEDAIRAYTGGQYSGIVGYSDLMHGGNSMWETKQFREGSETFAKRWLDTVDEQEKENSEAIYNAIVKGGRSPKTIIRTERDNSGFYPTREGQMYGGGRSDRFGLTPKIGDTLEFGIKSASKDIRFVEKIARDEIPGMGNIYGTVAETGSEVLAFRIKNATRYLDIDQFSEYAEQQESLIAGKYRVSNVTVKEIIVGAGKKEEVAVTPREFAEHNGLDIEYFTSKKGREMARFGTRTYPANMMDEVANLYIERESSGSPVKIKYVDLEELPMKKKTATQSKASAPKATDAQLKAMSRSQLESAARAVAPNQAASLGISEKEALERFDLLLDANTDAQLRKYIKRYQ